MRIDSALFQALLCASLASARHSLRYAGMEDKVVDRATHVQPAARIDERQAPLQYYNSKTAKFAVNGSGLPDVNFDIGESYSGLLPISNNTDDPNQLFFWFFPSTNPDARDEITVWLNGGPGCSSMLGIMSESGPWTWYGGTYLPVRNPFAFANLTNIVYVDQPVGAGYAVGTPSIHNEEELVQQFLGFWDNFIDTFSLQGKKTYITGESYAGMYCPYIANAMLQDDKEYNVEGMMIFDPSIISPFIQKEVPTVAFTRYHQNLFPLNDSYREYLDDTAATCGYDAYLEKWLVFPPAGHQPITIPGDVGSNGLSDAECDVYDSVYENMMFINPCWDIYNVLTKCPLPWDNSGFPGTEVYTPPGAPPPYFDRADVKAAIHAPNITWVECSTSPVFVNGTDTSLPSIFVIPQVVDATKKVIIAHGAVDMVLMANGTMLGIQNMTWGGQLGFQQRPTAPFYVPYHSVGDLTNWAGAGVFGTTHSERGLTWVHVDFSGHQIPEFAPSAAYRMLEVLLGRVDSMSSTAPFTTNPFPQPQVPLGNGNAPPTWAN